MNQQNLLLSVLPTDAVERLAPFTRSVGLEEGKVLHRPNQTIEHVYFPLDCLISVTITMADGRTTEAGMVGSWEMVGINAFMGGNETNQTQYVVQAAGTAVRIVAEPLLEEFDSNKRVRDVMLRYTQAYVAQLSQNVACNRMHTLEQRLARWIQECRDRLKSDELAITHEFLGQMLGVRRAGVSEAMSTLQDSGAIDYGRKTLHIADSAKLESISCECHRVLRDEYNRLLTTLRRDGLQPAL